MTRKRELALVKRLRLYEKRIWEIHDELVDGGKELSAGSDSITGYLDTAGQNIDDAATALEDDPEYRSGHHPKSPAEAA